MKAWVRLSSHNHWGNPGLQSVMCLGTSAVAPPTKLLFSPNTWKGGSKYKCFPQKWNSRVECHPPLPPPTHTHSLEKLKQNLLLYFLACWLSACQKGSCWFHCLPEDRKQSWQTPARRAALELSFPFSQWKRGICCQTWNLSWQNFSYAKTAFRQDTPSLGLNKKIPFFLFSILSTWLYNDYRSVVNLACNEP